MKCISVDEASARLGIGRTSLYNAARSLEIPHVRVNRRVLVDEDDLPAIIAIFKVQPKPTKATERRARRLP